ncbi:MAG: tripartite tricarboxylate transporter substrate binding protein [Rubrivivax sp.]|nr:tripartite tricarboxylate transporter substrate binding protein [Rubrivivax sp.]
MTASTLKTMSRRLLAVLAIAVGASAAAQGSYPDKPLRIVVGFPPGTTGDVLARALGPKLSEGLGQPVVIENRPGAGSSLAAEAVARSKPDGYTLLLSTTANVINPALYPGLSFDFARDLVPVALLAEAPALLVAHPSLAARTPAELVALARGKAGVAAYASSGNGTLTHLYGELFNQTTGTQLDHIPYKGSSQALTDLLAGRVALLFTPASTVLPHVKAGTLKALGTIGRQRLGALPELPTFAEAGIAGFDAALWFGLNAPAGTPQSVIDRLHQELAKALAQPEIKAVLAAQSIEVQLTPAAPFAALIAKDGARWATLVRSAGIKVQ